MISKSAASKSAPGARGRSLKRRLRRFRPRVGPRRAWTVPARPRWSLEAACRPRRAWTVPPATPPGKRCRCRPPARVDGPSAMQAEFAKRLSAPGARGRSRFRGDAGSGAQVGPRRAWTVPDCRRPLAGTVGRPPARVDGPCRPVSGWYDQRSAPGARGRSRVGSDPQGRAGVGPRRAWTVPMARSSRARRPCRPPARVDGP